MIDRLTLFTARKTWVVQEGSTRGLTLRQTNLPEADWLVAFDDDAYPDARHTGNVSSNLEIPDEVGSVAAAVYLPDGQISEMNRPSVNPFWHIKELDLDGLQRQEWFSRR